MLCPVLSAIRKERFLRISPRAKREGRPGRRGVDWSKPAEQVADAEQLKSRARKSFVWFLVFLAAAIVIFWGGLAEKSGWLTALGYFCALLGFGAFLDWVRSRRRLREVHTMRRVLEGEAKRLLSDEGRADRLMLAKMQNEKTIDLIGVIFAGMKRFIGGERKEEYSQVIENAIAVLMARTDTDPIAKEFLNDWSEYTSRRDLLPLVERWSTRVRSR